MILKEFNYYLKKATTLEEIQGSLIEKVNRWCDPSTGCIAHVYDTVLLKHWIVVSDNVVGLYKLDKNILLFNDFQMIYDRLDKIEKELDAPKPPEMVTIATNQTIAGVKTFSAPPVSATNPTANNQVANKAYVDSVGNTAVKLTGNQTIAGNKTLSGATTFNGAITSKGANTFSGNNTFNTGQVTFNNKAPICNVAPAADTNLVNRAYSKKRGGYIAVTGGAINLNNGINFSLNLTSKVNITVTNAASNIGQTGEIFVAKGANISGFSAPFNFRVAQSGFGNNEVFSYTVVSSSLVRIVRS
ncbi:hypothetical protein [Campylobacter vicugnae]|uniref:Tail fiber protein n=1 Tax=Campylobacter vicugnae TaxID=1660076 RepID=A0ABZ2E6G6_9BACT|nr:MULTISPECIES: hypothetical protein [unclassified Campylobacter]